MRLSISCFVYSSNTPSTTFTLTYGI
jgi:hypothetical protein